MILKEMRLVEEVDIFFKLLVWNGGNMEMLLQRNKSYRLRFQPTLEIKERD